MLIFVPKPVRRLYRAALTDQEFIDDYQTHEREGSWYKNNIPGLWESRNQKVAFAMLYYGWLLGKGRYTVGQFE